MRPTSPPSRHAGRPGCPRRSRPGSPRAEQGRGHGCGSRRRSGPRAGALVRCRSAEPRAARSGKVTGSDTGRPGAPVQRSKDTMSSTFHVRGGRPLSGEITVRGAKNLVSKAMVAALLGEQPSVLHSVPDIRDVQIVSELLSIHGVKIERDAESGTLHMDPSNVEKAHVADIDAHAGSSRIPILRSEERRVGEEWRRGWGRARR